MGLMAIIAGNPLTIILTWTAFDLVEVIVWLVIVDDQAKRRNSVVIFGIRMAGVVILLCAALSAAQNGQVLDFGAIPAAISPWLVLAAGVRLGVVPFQTPFHTETPMRQGLGLCLSPRQSAWFCL
jgi:hypothetical protein